MPKPNSYERNPLHWASLVPYYPWQPVCARDLCYELHPSLRGGGGRVVHQRVPHGSLRRRFKESSPGIVEVSEVQDCGHVFIAERPTIGPHDAIRGDASLRLVETVRLFAKQWYRRCALRPGLCKLSLGFEEVRGLRVEFPGGTASDNPSLEQRFSVSRMVDYEALELDPLPILADLFNEVLYCFDADPIPDFEAVLSRARFGQ